MGTEHNTFNEASLTFLEQYINTASPTGFEKAGQVAWLNYLKPFVDETFTDAYGTAVGVINPGAEFKVVIEAHADEISWFVHHITAEGFIYVRRNGGSDALIAPSKRVNIYGAKGIVKGVFGWPAIHTRENREREDAPTLKTIFIDIGAANKEEVEEMGVHVGCVAVFDDPFMILNEKYYCGRALDNRAGGFMIAEVARLLKEQDVKLPYSLYVVNSVQEEVGLRGAEMITQRIKPNIALVTDVTHDTQTPHINKIVQGDIYCGRGPVLSYGPSIHGKVLQLLLDSAAEKEIPFQRAAVSRVTGTDTDAFAYSNGGVPSALVSLPLRYMHTTVEMVTAQDTENVVRLLFEAVKRITPEMSLNYFD
jgi:putative aminopeptidase FrvX